MKAKINKAGRLLLQRNGIDDENTYVTQSCRFQIDQFCDVFCPLFGEPKVVRVMTNARSIETIQLSLCQKTLVFEGIIIEK